jgi:GDPmannose 4,6-dehydratase
VTKAAANIGVAIEWQGQGEEECGVVASAPVGSAMKPGHRITAIDRRYFRPAEVDTLLGDPGKAREILGWRPKTSFDELVSEMMAADLKLAQRDAMVTEAGYHAPRNRE